MTFSQIVKNEVLHGVRNVKGCCATSFLTAVVKSIGSLSLDFRGFNFEIESDNHDLLTFCKALSLSQLGINCQIESTNTNAKGLAVYNCAFESNVGEKLGLCSRDQDGAMQLCQDVDKLLPTKDCCKRAFLQALFVASGSVIIPQTDSDVGENQLRTKYHLELRFTDGAFAQAVEQAYKEIDFRCTVRKNSTILYLKDSEKIADFLVSINALSAKFKLENVIIGRSMRNTANRQSNCISANIEKSVIAGEKQLQAIAKLRQSGQIALLPDNLVRAIEAREAYPEATLDELASKLGVTKSGANHRYAKIIDIANNL